MANWKYSGPPLHPCKSMTKFSGVFEDVDEDNDDVAFAKLRPPPHWRNSIWNPSFAVGYASSTCIVFYSEEFKFVIFSKYYRFLTLQLHTCSNNYYRALLLLLLLRLEIPPKFSCEPSKSLFIGTPWLLNSRIAAVSIALAVDLP